MLDWVEVVLSLLACVYLCCIEKNCYHLVLNKLQTHQPLCP